MSNRKTRRAEGAKAKRKAKGHYDEEGNWVVPLPPEALEVVEELRQRFRAKFGRDPEGSEPVFFDPNHDTPRLIDEGQFEADLLEALKASGAPPAVVYAFKKTGRIVTNENEHLLPPGALEEWNAALGEFAEVN